MHTGSLYFEERLAAAADAGQTETHFYFVPLNGDEE
jgi:hypothetical protein